MALAAATAVGVLQRKAVYEARHRGPVEIVMDWPALEGSAAGWGRSAAEVATLLAREGVTTLALPEQTAGEVADLGRGWLLSPEQRDLLALAPAPAPAGRDAFPSGQGSVAAASTPQAGSPYSLLLRPGHEPLVLPAPLPAARDYGVGLPPSGIAAARAAGLAVLPRYGERPRLAGGRGQLAGAVVSRVALFEGNRVGTAGQLAELWEPRAALGVIEFSPQEGSRELARELGLRAVGVHSLRSEEVARLGPRAAAARYVRAVRERGVRMLYLRPSATLEETLAMVRWTREGLEAGGFRVGLWEEAAPFTGPGPVEVAVLAGALPGLVVLGLAAWAAAVSGSDPDGRLPAAVLLAGAALAAGLGVTQAGGWERAASVAGRQVWALLVALVAPVSATGAALSVVRPRPSPENGRGTRARAIARALAAGATFFAVTLAGGLAVGALLADSQFMLRVEQFRGVKAAHVLPPVGVAAATAGVLGFGPRAWLRALERPVRRMEVAAGAAVLALVAYYVARTGNELAPVPGWERALRGWLEAGLSVRPRTKEFLIGYPALAAALALWASPGARRMPVVVALLAGAGSVASVSVVNSWAHAHTPVAVTLLRVGNGLWLGLVPAACAWVAIRLALDRLAGEALPRWATGHAAAVAGPDRPGAAGLPDSGPRAGPERRDHGSVAS